VAALTVNRKAGNHTGLPLRMDHGKEKDRHQPHPQQALHILPPHVQAGRKRGCRLLPPLLPLQAQPGQAKARIHLEADGPGTLNAPRANPPAIDAERCTGCGRCVAACPVRLITLEVRGYRKVAELGRPERCDRCGLCVEGCPVGAIAL